VDVAMAVEEWGVVVAAMVEEVKAEVVVAMVVAD